MNVLPCIHIFEMKTGFNFVAKILYPAKIHFETQLAHYKNAKTLYGTRLDI